MSTSMSDTARRFLFLQGPHGPWFDQLARMLRAAGAVCWRVGFNAGDRFFWSDPERFIPYDAPGKDWPDHLEAILTEKGITDIVLYGDTRPIHSRAIKIAEARGLRVHVFEEGYLRPYWVTYERGGVNGHSRLMDMDVPEMERALKDAQPDLPPVPANWGDMRQHVFYGALYHFLLLTRNAEFTHFRPHRAQTPFQEFRLYLRRLLLMPVHAFERWRAQRRVRNGGFPYHLVLMQLEHDASFRAHSGYETMPEFLTEVIEGFVAGAPKHHHLVFKAHPLEDGRAPVVRTIRDLAQNHGVAHRVHFIRGGKLAMLLDNARSAVTINSTAGQQVLWRGLPLRTSGQAIYGKPEFVSQQPLPEFFHRADRPKQQAYRTFRRYLLETSQLPGGFYSARGRRQLLRQVVDLMMAPLDPYDALAQGVAPPRQQVHGSA